MFESSPEVSVGGGPGVAQKLYLRGFEDTLLNITIDGASQPGQTFHHTGRIGIEPELLKRAEVQAGTGDATSGPGALGGSIRFVTKDPDDLLREGEQVGALIKGGYFSRAEGYKTSSSLYGRFNENWSALAVATYQDQNDYEDGNGRDVLGTGARQQLGFAKLVGRPMSRRCACPTRSAPMKANAPSDLNGSRAASIRSFLWKQSVKPGR